jgi:hypothetical protein
MDIQYNLNIFKLQKPTQKKKYKCETAQQKMDTQNGRDFLSPPQVGLPE